VVDIEPTELLQTVRIPNNWMEKTIDLLTDRTARAARVLLITAAKLGTIQAGKALLGATARLRRKTTLMTRKLLWICYLMESNSDTCVS